MYPIRSTLFPEMIDPCASGDVDGDETFSLTTPTQFSTFCGCSGDGTTSSHPSTSTPITAAPTSNPLAPSSPSPAPNTDATCDSGESFYISSSIWPELEGCYVHNGYVNEGELIYSIAGTADYGDPWMYAFESDYASQSIVSTLSYLVSYRSIVVRVRLFTAASHYVFNASSYHLTQTNAFISTPSCLTLSFSSLLKHKIYVGQSIGFLVQHNGVQFFDRTLRAFSRFFGVYGSSPKARRQVSSLPTATPLNQPAPIIRRTLSRGGVSVVGHYLWLRVSIYRSVKSPVPWYVQTPPNLGVPRL